MNTSAAAFADLADQFLVAYVSVSVFEASTAALFNVGHAVELYLKAAHCAHAADARVESYGHDVQRLLNDLRSKEPELLAEYALRPGAIRKYVTCADLPAAAAVDPDYLHFNQNRELYWIATFLAETKYLFASPGKRLKGRDFVVFIFGLNEYWLPFFRQLRAYLSAQGVHLSTRLEKASRSEMLAPPSQGYLRALCRGQNPSIERTASRCA